eukprot:3580344-Prymnesium_polylepis.1
MQCGTRASTSSTRRTATSLSLFSGAASSRANRVKERNTHGKAKGDSNDCAIWRVHGPQFIRPYAVLLSNTN